MSRAWGSSLSRLAVCPSVLVAMLLAAGLPALAFEDPYKATSSRAARDEATRAIPYDQLDAGGKQKVSAILANVSVYRRLPTQVIRCEPNLYRFMVNHPDVTVNLWEALGVTQVQLSRTGEDTFRADDGAGTKGDVQYLLRGDNLHLIYSVGSYEGPLFHKPVRGGCLLMLRSTYSREQDGYDYITCQLDSFFCLEHVGIEVLAKTFQPLVGRAADTNFVETTNFLGALSRSGEARPTAMQNLADKLTKVRPEDREQFAMLMADVARKGAALQAARPAVGGDTGSLPHHRLPPTSAPNFRR